MKIIVEKPSVGRVVWEVPPSVDEAIQNSLESVQMSGLAPDLLEGAVIDQYQHLIEGFMMLLGQFVLIGGAEGIAISEMVNADLEQMVRKSAVIMGADPTKLV